LENPEMTSTEQTPKPAKRSRKKLAIIGGAVAVLAAAGITYAVLPTDGPPVDNGKAALAVHQVGSVGPVLVDQAGRTLYYFETDEPGVVTCTGGCAAKWPPLTLPAGQQTPDLGTGVDTKLVGHTAGENGAQVVTYKGLPLYRYASDDVGQANGHERDQNGGLWWAVTKEGNHAS
jgi:predicted lipoprotein with Yx(FWY)xxD motif